MPYEPPPSIANLSLEALAQWSADNGLPPLDKWTPQDNGHSRMRIDAQGQWFHDGAPITRPAMVRAFSRLLKREGDGQYWLVTPQEKQRIDVDDAPLLAVEMVTKAENGEQTLLFRTNTDRLVAAGPDAPLIARGSADLPALYLQLPFGVEARLGRNCYLDIIALAMAQSGDGWLAVRSAGQEFALTPP